MLAAIRFIRCKLDTTTMIGGVKSSHHIIQMNRGLLQGFHINNTMVSYNRNQHMKPLQS
jgi:hypothetical protein